LQTLGFSLNEIREFLSLRTKDLRARWEVQKMLDHKLHDVRAKRIALEPQSGSAILSLGIRVESKAFAVPF
jgi:DNA-binding transcriptional MerR regulator